MHQTLIRLLIRASLILGAVVPTLHAVEPQAGLSTFQSPAEALAGDVRVVRSRDTVAIDWPAGAERARLVLSLAKDRPLIRDIGIGARSVLADVDPAGVITVGTRDLKQGWTVFFDNPRNRPFERFPLVLRRDALSIQAVGGHTRVVVDGASAGPFSGTFEFTVYPGSPLVRAAMVMSTRREATAYTFDAGLSAPTAASLPWSAIAYTDMSDALSRLHDDALRQPATSPKVRGRTIIAEGTGGGALALLPPPHQYFYPLDYANNDHSA
ncbi:MAG TPA: hypothetical protein VHF86_07750, partial [Xanthomonadaceae bacterium]|nr:hypothetical protein [Xanthomonadaceae bacterium]